MTDRLSAAWAVYKFWLVIRGSLFWIVFLPSVLLFALLLTLATPLPIGLRVSVIKQWIRINLTWIKLTCGLGYQIEGLENIPSHKGFIVMSKHSSTWETIALQAIFPRQVWF